MKTPEQKDIIARPNKIGRSEGVVATVFAAKLGNVKVKHKKSKEGGERGEGGGEDKIAMTRSRNSLKGNSSAHTQLVVS